MKEYYKITEVARLYGLCTDTLRYYEEQGLLHPHRSEAGYRLYSIDDICNLNVIRALRELDMPVEHMRRYFGERTVASTLDMLDEQDAAIRARIAALRDARAAVDARRARLERYDGQEPGLLRLLELPERPCLQLQEDVILEREIDFALKKLAHRHEEVIRALGTQCMGAVLDTRLAEHLGVADLPQRVEALWLEKARAALAEHETTFALLPMSQILEKDGYLEKLRAEGYEIEVP